MRASQHRAQGRKQVVPDAPVPGPGQHLGQLDGRGLAHIVGLALADGRPVGTGRLLPDGHIGRMAVQAAWRGRGVGAALLQALIAEAGRRGMAQLALSAQTHALGFYGRFGFLPEGEVYDEAGLPHQVMTRRG